MSGLIRDYPGGSAQLHRLILDRDDEQDGDDHNGDDHDGDIYIMMHVCLFVTKNDHFLLGVSCNHLNHP